MSFNRYIFDLVHGWFTAGPAGMTQLVVFGAVYLPVIAAVVCLVVFFHMHASERRAWLLLELILSLVLATFVFADTLQALTAHVRPYVLLGFTPGIPPVAAFSFPSAHASALFAVAATIRLHHRFAGDALIFLGLVNGLARIAVGVHWPIDIVGGLVTGVAAAVIAHMLVRFTERKHRHA